MCVHGRTVSDFPGGGDREQRGQGLATLLPQLSWGDGHLPAKPTSQTLRKATMMKQSGWQLCGSRKTLKRVTLNKRANPKTQSMSVPVGGSCPDNSEASRR